MTAEEDRRSRVLKQASLQELWALLLIALILLGIALLFGRQVGYGISFGASLGLLALVTVSFLLLHAFDRATARFLNRQIDKRAR
jgi:hypothetical protein